MKFLSFDETKEIYLKSCPFCGGIPRVKRIGNSHTKKIALEISCTLCRVTRIDGSLTKSGYGFSFLETKASEQWNQRIDVDGSKNEEQT